MALRLSVIVCAHNEAQYLSACLHSLFAQSRIPDEVIVVNNASTDATGDVLVYLDADCRAPLAWLERVERKFLERPELLALSGPYRYYDWNWWGRTLIRAYDFTLAPATQMLVKYVLGIGTIFYGGNFAVRRESLERIGGFDTTIEFHGEDTNLGRRLHAAGRVELFYDCYLYTSARRFVAMGNGAVFRLYVRNFTSELLHHRPRDSTHLDVRI